MRACVRVGGGAAWGVALQEWLERAISDASPPESADRLHRHYRRSLRALTTAVCTHSEIIETQGNLSQL